MAALLVGLVLGLGSEPGVAQTVEPLSEARLRTLARQAQRESKGDATEMVLALDKHVRERWGDFESFPVSIVHDEDLLVTVTAPYMAFRRSIVDVLRTGRSIERAAWTGTVEIAVTPRRLGASDIESVNVSRDGQRVAPVKASLRPMTFSNGTGIESVLHAGEVHFSPAAFLPRAHVVLTLTPLGGDPIVYTFSDSELATLR